MRIHRNILHEYPLPIARVYERAVNAEEGKDSHDRSLLVFEVLVQWLALLALAAARASPAAPAAPGGAAPTPASEALRRFPRAKLERPSRGIWVELLRTLAGQGEGFLDALGGFLREPLDDPDLSEFLQAVSKNLGPSARRQRQTTPARVIDLLVNYRNRTIGHGASLEPEVYAALSAPLLNGMGALLSGARFLLEFPLFRCEEHRHRADRSVASSVLRLMGNVPVREPRLQLPEGVGAGAIFVLPAGGSGGWFPVSPLALYREKSLYLYNGLGQDGVPRYLCFDDNSQIAEGKKEDLLGEAVEIPAGGPVRPDPTASIRLRVSPERVRAGEPFLLRVEILGVPKGRPLRLSLGVDPPGSAVHLGPSPAWEGLADASVPLSFPFTALGAGQLRMTAGATSGKESVAESVEVAVGPRTSLPFVGRARAVERLREWSDAEEGGLFILRGEPGVGKSRLAREIALGAVQRGTLLVGGKGRKSFRLPLQPFREILLTLLHQVESEVDQAGVLDFLQATLRHRLPDESYIADYFRAFLARDSIAPEQKAMVPYYWLQLFHRFSEGRPVLAVIDDLQWAEAESLQLLAEVLGLAHQRGARLKVLAIVQPFGPGPEELKTLQAIDTRVRALESDRIRVETLDLRPLEDSELDSLVDVSFPGNAFRQELPWLYKGLRQKTGGNPLFAEWVLKRLRSDAESRVSSPLEEKSAWSPGTSLTPGWFEELVPREIESVLDQRLSGLTAEAREAAQVAAAIGDPFDLRLLENLLGGVGALDRTLPFLEEEELVVPTADPSFYRFAHSLIPQRIYRDFTERSRWKASRLHGRIADTMSALYSPPELSQHALVYAHHLVLGNRREESLQHLITGAGRLLEQQLYPSALAPLETAHGLAKSGVPIGGLDRSLLLLRLGETYRVLGRIDDAVKALEEASQASGAASAEAGGGAKEGTISVRASIELARGSIQVQRGELNRAEETFRSILSLPLPESQRQAAGAVSGLASVERIRGRLADSLREHQRALALRETMGAETEVAISCVNVGNLHVDLGEPEKAERAYRRSLPIFESRGLKNYLVYALSGLGNVFFRSDRAQAMEFYQKAMRLCQETGNRAQLGVLHYNLGELALLEHRYSVALREVQRALGIMEAVGRRSGEAGARCRLADLLRILGEHEAAAAEVARAREVSRVTGSNLDLVQAHVQGSRVALASRNQSLARQELEAALGLLAVERERPLRLACVQLLIELGDLERARLEIEEAEKAPGAASDTEARCLLEHVRGRTCADPSGRREHLRRALQLAGEDYEELPSLLSDLASELESGGEGAAEEARELHRRAVGILKRRTEGIEDLAGRRRYLQENPIHRGILERAVRAGAEPASPGF